MTIAPQLPSDWDNASVSTPALTVTVSGFRQRNNVEKGIVAVAVALHELMPCVGCDLVVHLPLRAVELVGVAVNGIATQNFTVQGGWGQAVVVVRTRVASPGVPVTVSLSYANAIGYRGARHVQVVAGGDVALEIGLGDTTFNWSVMSVDDPQAALASDKVVGGIISATAASNRSGYSLVCVNIRLLTAANTTSGPIQRRLFKINATDPIAEARVQAQTSVNLYLPPANK